MGGTSTPYPRSPTGPVGRDRRSRKRPGNAGASGVGAEPVLATAPITITFVTYRPYAGRVAPIEVEPGRFEEMVADALDALPEDLGRLMRNVAVTVEHGLGKRRVDDR